MTAIVILAAVADNGVIGADNQLPWRLSSDMKRLKAITMGKPIVMGRKTFQSLGRPLPGRDNIVVTRQRGFSGEGIFLAASLDRGLEIAERQAAERGVDEVVVFGGGEIYRQAIGRADTLYITEVHVEAEGDTRFPAIDPALWVEVSRERHEPGERDSAAFSFVTYQRRRSS